MYLCDVWQPHVEADAIVPSKFHEDMCAIDEMSEAVLRDARGFAAPVLRSS